MLKKLVGYPLSYILFWIGEVFLYTQDSLFDDDTTWSYAICNWCMEKSGNLQEWYNGSRPWTIAKAIDDDCGCPSCEKIRQENQEYFSNSDGNDLTHSG